MGGRGDATEEQLLFADLPLSLPDMVEVETVVEKGTLTAFVSWNNTVMDGALTEEFSTEVKLLDKEDNILDTMTVDHPLTGFNYTLKDDVPYDVRFILTTLGKEEEGDSSMARPLFSDDVDLAAPRNISLQHGVKDNVMKATLTWDPVLEVFGRLVTVVQLYDKEGQLYDLPKYMPAGESR